MDSGIQPRTAQSRKLPVRWLVLVAQEKGAVIRERERERERVGEGSWAKVRENTLQLLVAKNSMQMDEVDDTRSLFKVNRLF